MQYNKMGKSGLYVSRICLGTMAFGRLADEKESFRIMDEALDNGITFFDSANAYGGGKSEEIIGKWFAQGGGRREKVVMCTKFNAAVGETAELDGANNMRGLSGWKIRRHLDDSLRRLQTDHVEIYMMHRVDRSVKWTELWSAFSAQYFQGKFDYVASSAFSATDLAECNKVAHDFGMMGLICDQHRYNLVTRQPELEVIPALRKHGMGLMCYSPVGGGHLSGKAMSDPGPRSAGRTLHDYQKEQLLKFKAFAEKKGVAEAILAQAWLLHNPEVSSILAGPRTIEMLHDTLAALDVQFSDEEILELETIFPSHGMCKMGDIVTGHVEATDAYNW
ncbi:MAG: aldo/keto reductase [Clostridiales bacterium]|nr:aldo/keto reductase [Clostridiales bacterium]